MTAGVTPSVFMHRMKPCGMLHGELPWWYEAEMEVHRGKAARSGRSWLLQHWEYPVLPKALGADTNAATGRIGSLGRCHQVAMQIDIDPEAQNMGEKQGRG